MTTSKQKQAETHRRNPIGLLSDWKCSKRDTLSGGAIVSFDGPGRITLSSAASCIATEHPELEGLLTSFICEFGPVFTYSLPIL